MPTLRDRVRETLSAREPGEREAARELETLRERASGGGRRAKRGVAWPLLLAPALAVAALVFLVVLTRRGPVAPARMAAAKGGTHLYLNIAGEPANRAITVDLDSKGEL